MNCIESVYCEPRDVAPYATSEDSDKDSVGSADLAAGGGTGRRLGRPRDWRIRQNIPLPPKPDECGLRTSPPPPYYPIRPLPPPVPAPRPHAYVNEHPTNCYFQPLSDEEARLVQTTQAADNPAFEAENVYLEGRRDDDGEAIELQNLSGDAAGVAEGTQDTSTQNRDHITGTDRRDVVYAIRRDSPTDLGT